MANCFRQSIVSLLTSSPETAPEHRGYLVPFGVDSSPGSVPSLVPCYVAPRDGLQRPPSTVIGALAFFALDRETPIGPSTALQLRMDLAVVRRCCQLVLEAVAAKSPVSLYCQVTHPGHHAGAEFFGGFCFVNNAAVFARHVQRRLGARVAVLDVDYHAGNGTMSVFYSDPSVLVVSLHADPSVEYPFNAGFPDQTGAGPGSGTTLNLCLGRGTRWPAYRAALEKGLQKIAEFGPAVLAVSLGLDTLAGDPVAFPTAAMQLEVEDFGRLGEVLLNDPRVAHLPKAFFQEGGYLLDDVTKGVLNFFVADKNNNK